MMPKQNPKQWMTNEQLEKLSSDGLKGLKLYVKFIEDTNDFIAGVRNATVPPGTPPPNPPGIPR